jgi:hypothetical protein
LLNLRVGGNVPKKVWSARCRSTEFWNTKVSHARTESVEVEELEANLTAAEMRFGCFDIRQTRLALRANMPNERALRAILRLATLAL